MTSKTSKGFQDFSTTRWPFKTSILQRKDRTLTGKFLNRKRKLKSPYRRETATVLKYRQPWKNSLQNLSAFNLLVSKVSGSPRLFLVVRLSAEFDMSLI